LTVPGLLHLVDDRDGVVLHGDEAHAGLVGDQIVETEAMAAGAPVGSDLGGGADVGRVDLDTVTRSSLGWKG
jgi:hypothetical protein